MTKLVFATNNPGKLDEIRSFAKKFNIEVLSPSDLKLSFSVNEGGKSYAENALLKMQALLAQITDEQLWVAGDDSGIGIDALGGAPGIRTRRWAGYEMSDQEIIDYTLSSLKGLPKAKRTAHFNSVVAIGKLNSEPKIFKGQVSGYILDKPNKRISLQPGLPFRNLFHTDEGRYLGHNLNSANHRQQAFKQIFEYISP
jgi:XTP/dITP diphosphohydrolase